MKPKHLYYPLVWLPIAHKRNPLKFSQRCFLSLLAVLMICTQWVSFAIAELRTVSVMHPQGYPIEAVQMQGMGYGGLPGQPGVVQHTAVNITAGQQVITESPKDHIIWSLFSFVYANPFCLGLAALIYSIKARDRKMVGDVDGARHYGSTARCLNITATVIAVTGFLIFIITLSVIAAQATSHYSYNRY
ncbi:unnamed protein product [Oreochromis niloticus]|nr:unnamed protein product [Mustela putorius furo]